MSECPTVSVVVPAFNAERTLGETIRSLLAQSYPRDSLELIVVNNASTDSTAQILDQYAGHIRPVYEAKRGRSSARNAGLRAARNEIVAFIDSDCIADSDWLRQLVPALEDREVGVVGGRILAARPCNAVEEFGEWLHDHSRSIQIFRPAYAITPNWGSRRQLLEQVSGFDEALPRGEDCDLSYRIQQAGLRIVYEDKAIVHQRNRANLRALFGEGFDDGMYSVKVQRKHAWYLRGFGHRSINFNNYSTLAKCLARLLKGSADARARFEAVFTAGKIAGKLCGSARYGWVEL
jgi:mycofactocin glycosyltransferase